jgi:excisionase family DNA binding protein
MLISLSQAAELLGYSTSGLRKLVRRREIQYFQARPHSPIKFRREWLDEFVESGSTKPGPVDPGPRPRKRKTPPLKSGAHGFDASLLKRAG